MIFRHGKFQNPKKLEGTVQLEAGAILNDAGQMIGSVRMLEFPSELEARAWLEADLYVTGKV